MDFPISQVAEGMVELTQVLVETPHLRSWFYSLEPLSDPLRRAAFMEMASRMRDAQEDAAVTAAIDALARPKMYETVLATIRERVGETGSNLSNSLVKPQRSTHETD